MAPAVSAKLVEKLMKNYSLSRAQAVQIVNIAPINPEELKTILDARSSDLTDEQIIEQLVISYPELSQEINLAMQEGYTLEEIASFLQ